MWKIRFERGAGRALLGVTVAVLACVIAVGVAADKDGFAHERALTVAPAMESLKPGKSRHSGLRPRPCDP